MAGSLAMPFFYPHDSLSFISIIFSLPESNLCRFFLHLLLLPLSFRDYIYIKYLCVITPTIQRKEIVSDSTIICLGKAPCITTISQLAYEQGGGQMLYIQVIISPAELSELPISRILLSKMPELRFPQKRMPAIGPCIPKVLSSILKF